MRFQPQSEAQIQESSSFSPWPPGIYDFEIFEAEERTSKGGNEMIALTIFVYNKAGERRTVFDYLLPSILYKLKHAAEACGAGEKYERGVLMSTDFHGKTGRLKLRIDPAKDGYAAKNAVQDYIVDNRDSRQMEMTAPRKSLAEELNDDVPF